MVEKEQVLETDYENNCSYSDPDGTMIAFAQRSGSYTMANQHFHNFYEVYYLLGGSRYYFIKDNTYYVKAGDLVLVDKRELHRTLETMEKFHYRVLMNVYDHMIPDRSGHFKELLSELFQEGSLILSFKGEDKEYMDDLVGRMYQEIRQKETGYELQVRNYVLQILIFAARNRVAWRKKAEDSLRKANKRIFEILNYIKTHYAENLSLESVAQEFFISKFYLSHAFKEVTGFTFVEYLSNIRIKEAQRLLYKTSYPVAQIAEMVGFGTMTHFGRVFRKISGESPLNYRKTERQYEDRERALNITLKKEDKKEEESS